MKICEIEKRNMRKQVSGEEILDLWKTTQQPIGVYIHSAFCKEQCTYCNFKGTLFNKNNYRQYYDEYLPKMIEFYGDVLSSPQINGYFFGGGTPTLMSPSEMRSLFDIIPNFKSQRNKLMEMHVCDWNKEQLDTLREYNFNIVIVCVQTFDRDALKKYKRRVPKDIEEVCEHIRYANSIGFETNSDVLFLDTGDIAKDLDRLMTDIQILADNNISVITIPTIFDEEGKFDNLVTATVELFLNKNPEYAIYNTFSPVGGGIDIPISYRQKNDGISGRCFSLRIIRRDVDPLEMFHWIPQVEEMSKWPHGDVDDVVVSNTLGIGSYSNYKDTYSTIEDRIEYSEVGDLNSPEFYITYNKLDYKIKDMIALFYEELEAITGEEPPDGINFNFSTFVDSVNPDSPNKQVKRELVVGVDFPKKNNNYVLSEYIKKFQLKLKKDRN